MRSQALVFDSSVVITGVGTGAVAVAVAAASPSRAPEARDQHRGTYRWLMNVVAGLETPVAFVPRGGTLVAFASGEVRATPGSRKGVRHEFRP
jgi:hypothetical protein